jgi:phosphatidylinositol glycan class Z
VHGYNVSLPWEYTGRHPIRSVLFPSVSVGLPNAILRLLFGSDSISALSLMRVPRVFTCLLSYLVDASMYFAAFEVGRDPLYPLVILNLSHVMLVYSFRTLSNTMELILFSLLMWR